MPNQNRQSVTDNIRRWRRDPVAFITEVPRNPETGLPFELYPDEERFIRFALTVTPNGRLPYVELLFSGPKKSGKTAIAALVILYVIVVLGGQYAEGYCCANDLEQSTSRVFQATCRIIQASPLLRNSAKITSSKIEFLSTGSTITAIASDFAGAAGSAPSIVCFDELWGYVSERSQRLWDEMVCPVPTRQISVRLTVTYAGFSGESTLLENLWKRGMAGELVGPDLYKGNGMLAFITHRCPAPWQTEAWREEMLQQRKRCGYPARWHRSWLHHTLRESDGNHHGRDALIEHRSFYPDYAR